MSQYIDKGKCIKPIIRKDPYDSWAHIFTCGNPDECPEFFNETCEDHHYGCECHQCVGDYWALKQ